MKKICYILFMHLSTAWIWSSWICISKKLFWQNCKKIQGMLDWIYWTRLDCKYHECDDKKHNLELGEHFQKEWCYRHLTINQLKKITAFVHKKCDIFAVGNKVTNRTNLVQQRINTDDAMCSKFVSHQRDSRFQAGKSGSNDRKDEGKQRY